VLRPHRDRRGEVLDERAQPLEPPQIDVVPDPDLPPWRRVAVGAESDEVELAADRAGQHCEPGGALEAQLAAIGIPAVDFVLSTQHTQRLLPQITQVLRPFGELALIDDPEALDIVPLKRKSLTVHWELMFTRSMFGHAMASQGEILAKVAALIDAGTVRSTMRTRLHGVTAANVGRAHAAHEAGTAIGKIVITR
jgi:NADPH:quinone reductase-like Zn-dependent oxidoreductase